MPEKVIEIPGVGNVAFPDTMSDDQISAVIQKQQPNLAIKAHQAEKFPASTTGKPTEAPWYSAFLRKGRDSNASAGRVASDRAADVLTGIPGVVTGIPGMVKQVAGAIGNPGKQAELVKNLVVGATAPVVTPAQQFIELVKPGLINAPTPDSPESVAAAEGAGTALGGAIVEGVRPHAVAAAKAGARAVLPSSEALQEMASANKARAISPTTLQGRADVARISEEMSQRGGAKGIRGKTIDRNILTDLDTATERLNTVENRLRSDPRPELQTPKTAILDEIDAAKQKLKIPRTGATAYPEAVAQLDDVRALIDKMPDYIDFDQLIELRRQLDRRAQDAGAFGVNADTLKAQINRGAADMVRGQLNALDPELKIANHDYSVMRRAADVVERRQLGEAGKITSGLPGRGGVVDDILATWAGHALGGTPGAAVAEVANLARQSRGFANIKSGFQQKLADMLKRPVNPPRGLLPPGPVRVRTGPDTSSVTATTPRQPKLLGPAADVVDVTGTVQPLSGQVFEMPPPKPTKFLGTGQKALPAGVYEMPRGAKLLPDSLEKIGSAVSNQSPMAQTAAARLAQIKDVIQSGATETTGKGLRSVNPETGELGSVVRRGGGGIKVMFPELEHFPESPSEIAAAIDRGEGALFKRVQQAVKDALPEQPTGSGATDFDFGANAPIGRLNVFSEMRRRRNLNPPR